MRATLCPRCALDSLRPRLSLRPSIPPEPLRARMGMETEARSSSGARQKPPSARAPASILRRNVYVADGVGEGGPLGLKIPSEDRL